jgi:hypothetical protein
MSQRISGYARQPDDEYETPAWCTRVVAPYLAKMCLRPWDPANGPQSAIAEELRACGFEAWATNDNFLIRTSPPYPYIDGVCTNPPYGSQGKLACQFISHALNLVPVVAMLLRIDFDSGKTRTHLFRDSEAFARKIVLLDRIVWFERDARTGRLITTHGSSGIGNIAVGPQSPTNGSRNDSSL